ncbi:MAG: putative DNA binding domain-containing protein [Candidatus Omnitrophica bacterium]|nr:putative DNA binding domain-containing protein [Candidatus Omnitrophota bacterium]
MRQETETTEFKKSTAELKSGVISVAAILNKHGKGELYFGIKDDGTVVGQTVGRHTIKEVTQTIVDNIEPKIYPKIATKKIKNKECIVVEFHGADTPYFAYGRAYMRVGESDKQMTAKQIEEQIAKKKRFLWEKDLSEKAIADVNENAIKEFMRKAKTAKRIDFEFVNVRTTLHKLHLLSRKHLTHAAEVLFCDDTQMEIQAAIFAGTDKLTFLDIKSFKGNLFNLRQQAEIYVNGNMRWRADLSGSRRKEIPEIPVRAISEAIGNSLCHRNFENPKGNEVAIFKDRIEVYNPGLFPEGVNPEDFFSGHEHSILRNPLIAETMYKSKDIERWGSGIKRIHDECVSVGVRVDFKRLKTGFVVVFYRPKWEDGDGLGDGGQTGGQTGGQRKIILNDKQKRIIEIIKVNPKVSRKELAEGIGINPSAIQKHLAKLKDAGYLRRIGPNFGGHWEII